MSDNKKYISTININNTVYDVKDAEARASLSNAETDIKSKIDSNVNSDVSAVLNFVNGVQINGANIQYSSSNNTVTFS